MPHHMDKEHDNKDARSGRPVELDKEHEQKDKDKDKAMPKQGGQQHPQQQPGQHQQQPGGGQHQPAGNR